MNSKLLFFIIAITGFAIDRIVKYFALNIPAFFGGVFVNENFAWGIPISNNTVLVFMSFAIASLAVLSIKSKNLAFLILIMGALSNLIDRIFYGGVIDYIHVPFGGIINLADIMVFLGAALLFV